MGAQTTSSDEDLLPSHLDRLAMTVCATLWTWVETPARRICVRNKYFVTIITPPSAFAVSVVS